MVFFSFLFLVEFWKWLMVFIFLKRKGRLKIWYFLVNFLNLDSEGVVSCMLLLSKVFNILLLLYSVELGNICI